MWFIYTVEYYSAIKNKDIMNFAGKWMKLENILSEVNQIQKGYAWFVLTYNYIFTTKYRISVLESIGPKKINSKEGPKKDVL